jgi:cation transport ATPase
MILRRKIMRYKLLVLLIWLSLCGAAAADTIQVTVNGTVCSLCATGIEKTFRAQPEVKTVDVDLENKLVTIHTREGQTIDDSKIRKLLGSAGYSVTGIVRKK